MARPCHIEIHQILIDRTRIIVFESSLESKCMDALIETCCRRSDDFATKLRGNPMKLPPLLRKEMLRKMELIVHGRDSPDPDLDLMWAETNTALSLMCSQITSFDFGCIESSFNPIPHLWNEDEKQKMITNDAYKLLAENHSSSLQKMLYSPWRPQNYPFEDRFHYEFVPLCQFPSSMHSSVLQMTNLKVLLLTEYFLDGLQFGEIGKKLINLQQLRCKLKELVCDDVISAVENLEKLEVFEVMASPASYDKQEPDDLLMLCSILVQKFARLKFVGPRVDGLIAKSHVVVCHNLGNIQLWNGPSQLTHLSLDRPLTAEQARMVPNINALMISDKQNGVGVDAVMMLEKLKSLTLVGELDWDSIHHLLEKIGPCLQQLSLYQAAFPDLHPSFWIGELVRLCPNLKVLNASCVQQIGWCQFGIEFANLTKICINSMLRCPLSGNSLCQIFCPPNLEVVELWDISLEDDELWRAVDIMEYGPATSQKLREIRGSQLIPSRRFNRRMGNSVPELWDQFFLLLSAQSPNLKVFHFTRLIPYDQTRFRAKVLDNVFSMFQDCRIMSS